ncbi:MAG: rRNA pseudouridine synthase [Phycisphaeraceae bacterium]|nr:rRNA pseudouridine synthase [Phycisphaeraceae bacterium]
MPRAGRKPSAARGGPRGGSRRPASTAPPGMVRLQRLMADAGVASRRRCEEMIEAGMVEVNGTIVNRLPVFVNPRTDKVVVDGRPLRAATGERPADARKLYVMLHKPAGVVCSTRDQFERTTVVDLVKHPAGARLYPVGRLEFNASGLVLLTNDGDMTERLTHARHGATRTYRVTVKGAIDDAYAADLERGLNIKAARAAREAGGRAGQILVRVASRLAAGTKDERAQEKTVLEISVRAGKHRHLDDMLAEAGLRATRIEQVGLGPLTLSGLAPGNWRELERAELAALRRPFGDSERRA